MPRSNLEWKFWGRHDPLWAVAAWRSRRKDGPEPWTDEDFYALGESDWRDFVARWERYGLRRGHLVEIGCGAGRLTAALAPEFETVTAVDVSPDMLAYARDRIVLPHVRFVEIDDCALPCPDASVDAVFSTHVFQHLDDPGDVERYLREIARTLSPGGSMMIHVPVFAWPWGAGKLVKRLYSWVKRWEDLRVRRQRRRLARGKPVVLMRMRSYPIGWFFDLLPRLGLTDVEICVFVTTSNQDPHPFVMARKPATWL